MLPGEQSLPREILAYHSNIVNQVFDFVCTDANNYRADRFKRIIKALQLWWFRQSRKQLFCPRCGGNQHIRKGWRSRILRSSQGRFILLVLQIRCKCCGRTFRPFTEALGLQFSRRFTDEMVNKAIALAMHNSFDRSSKLLAGLTAGTVSHEGIRQKIAARAETITGSTDIAEKTVLVDSTKVKAGRKERGSSVQIAITAEPGPMVSGRPTIRKQLVHLHVGDVEALRDRFSVLQPERLVHDGDVDFSLCAGHVQRCRWHLVHQLKHYLWQDGVPYEDRGAYQSRLKDIIFGEWTTAPKMLSDFIKELEAEGCLTSAEHLRNARHETFTYRADKKFTYTTTTPLEREMRELNRRADVGVRWSNQGIENVLKVLFHYRLNALKLKEPERVLLN
jgi:hypothetical protein